jgi:hypothetical protein
MSNCYVCGCAITNNNTYQEHIILNSIGGRLVDPCIICQSCAPSFDAIDAALSSHLNFAGLMLNIKRDRGNNPHIKAKVVETGEDIHLIAGGKPVQVKPIIKENKDDGSINITARDSKQMREVFKGLQRKYSFAGDIETLIKKAHKTEDYFDKLVNYNVNIGGDKCFRAICKMIVSFYMHKGGNREQILHLIPSIKDGKHQDIVWHYYPVDKVLDVNFEPIQVLHHLLIKGNYNEKIMYGFVELFSTFKFLVLICDDYVGEDFCNSYSFDVLSRSAVESTINLNLSRETVLNAVKLKEIKLDELKNALHGLMTVIKKKQADDCISNIVQKSIDTAFSGLTSGSIPSDEMIRTLIDNFSEEFAKFIYLQGDSINNKI